MDADHVVVARVQPNDEVEVTLVAAQAECSKGRKMTLQRRKQTARMKVTGSLTGGDQYFWSAHEVVGKAVRFCVEHGKEIPDLTLEEFRRFSADIDHDIFDYVTLEASVNARKATGGTAREAVAREINLARQALEEKSP